MGGTYSLVLAVERDSHLDVGALAGVAFPAGTYAYTGSAFGAGGFARVDRHRELAAGDRTVRHWHVDSVLGHEATELVDVVTTPAVAIECAVADRLPAGPGDGFGASDCDCDGHLARGVTVDAVEHAHEAAAEAATASESTPDEHA